MRCTVTRPWPHSPFLTTESQEPPARGLQGQDRLCVEHPTGESGPSLHSYLCPGTTDPGNKAMCVWQPAGQSHGAVPTSQTRFKAGASSTERHRDLFLLPSLTLPSTWCLLLAGLGTQCSSVGRGGFSCCASPSRSPGTCPGSLSHRQHSRTVLASLCPHILLGHPCPPCPRAVACRAAPCQDGHVPDETHQLIAPRASRELGR